MVKTHSLGSWFPFQINLSPDSCIPGMLLSDVLLPSVSLSRHDLFSFSSATGLFTNHTHTHAKRPICLFIFSLEQVNSYCVPELIIYVYEAELCTLPSSCKVFFGILREPWWHCLRHKPLQTLDWPVLSSLCTPSKNQKQPPQFLLLLFICGFIHSQCVSPHTSFLK